MTVFQTNNFLQPGPIISLSSGIHYQQQVTSSNPGQIFLTGATGLLGANLLGYLLEHTKSDIYCLVRGKNDTAGKNRLIEKLQLFGLWQQSFDARIIPMIGDLGLPQLGLSDTQFQRLAIEIDIIYHSAAQLNMIRTFDQLKTENVLSTECLLRLAALHHTKSFHFISSLSVFAGIKKHKTNTKRAIETDTPIFDETAQSGYIQTKIASEQLIREAQKRGLPASIYRIGRIMGNSKTGVMSNLDDLLCMIWKYCITLKKTPLVNTKLTFLPVDFAAPAVGHLSLSGNSPNKTFHIYNQQMISWQELFNYSRTFGYSLEEYSHPDWVNILHQEARQRTEENREDAQLSFLSSIASSVFAEKIEFSTFNTVEGLAGTGIVCPAIDENMLHTYLAYLEKINFLPAAHSSVVERWRRRAEMKMATAKAARKHLLHR